MNENRTYGIEIECHTKIGMTEMAIRLNGAFANKGIGHLAQTNSYTHNVDGTNRTVWIIKPDGSVHSALTDYPFNMEIVTPVLRGTEGIKALQVVCETLADVATVSRTCGLHVHHGVSSNEVKAIINAWRKVEKHFFKLLPNSRQNNSYCRTFESFPHMRDVRSDESVRDWEIRTIGTRYVSMNVESYLMRSTLEFRCHSGSVDFGKIKNWTILTQTFIDKAGQITNDMEFDQLLETLQQTTSVGVVGRPRPTTKDEVFVTWTNGAAISELTEIFSIKAKPTTIKSWISGWKNGRGLPAGRGITTETTVSEDITEAVTWARARRDHFGR